MDPAVIVHLWSCSTVAMLVTEARSLSLFHFFIHTALWHYHLISAIMLSNFNNACVNMCMAALSQQPFIQVNNVTLHLIVHAVG